MALTTKDAEIVLGMVGRGDKRHDVAAWFGENQARIAEVEQGHYGNLVAAPVNQLPPKGAPGPKGRRLRMRVDKALDALKNGDTAAALHQLEVGIENYDKNSA